MEDIPLNENLYSAISLKRRNVFLIKVVRLGRLQQLKLSSTLSEFEVYLIHLIKLSFVTQVVSLGAVIIMLFQISNKVGKSYAILLNQPISRFFSFNSVHKSKYIRSIFNVLNYMFIISQLISVSVVVGSLQETKINKTAFRETLFQIKAISFLVIFYYNT